MPLAPGKWLASTPKVVKYTGKYLQKYSDLDYIDITYKYNLDSMKFCSKNILLKLSHQ